MTAGWWVLVAAGLLALTAVGLWRWERRARLRATTALLLLSKSKAAFLETAALEYQYQLPAYTPEHEMP